MTDDNDGTWEVPGWVTTDPDAEFIGKVLDVERAQRAPKDVVPHQPSADPLPVGPADVSHHELHDDGVSSFHTTAWIAKPITNPKGHN